MSTMEKRLKKFYRKPIPNDITFDDVRILASKELKNLCDQIKGE